VQFKTLLYLVVDLLCLNLGFYIAFALRFGTEIEPSNVQALLRILPSLNVVYLVLLWGLGLYSTSWKSTSELFSSIFITSALTAVLSMALAFFLRGFALPRSIVLVGFVCEFVLLFIWRFGIRSLEEKRTVPKRVLVIGEGRHILELALKLLGTREDYQLLEVVPPLEHDRIVELFPQADLVCFENQLGNEKRVLLRRCVEESKQVIMVPSVEDILLLGAQFDRVDDQPILKLESLDLSSRQQMVKRICDLVLSLVLLILTSPLQLIVALLIKLDSPGPVLYFQERLGERRKTFRLIKFRTMVVDAEKKCGPVLAKTKDPRITRLGRFLRAIRLDELPQLVNIFLGQMSFVGPRPERQFFVEQFEESLPEYRYRMLVKPGLTGLAQVLGKYSTVFDDKLRYDLIYIRSYSLLLDFQIMLLTLRVIFIPSSARGSELSEHTLQLRTESSSRELHRSRQNL
jgi:exopolysaccharide biosynthesis polyprenyl glycosylphosphotransferase